MREIGSNVYQPFEITVNAPNRSTRTETSPIYHDDSSASAIHATSSSQPQPDPVDYLS